MSRFARIAGLALSALAATAAASSREFAPAEPRRRKPLGELKDFDAVSLGGPDTMLVTAGDDFSIAVEGDPEAVERLDIYVEDHVLHVARQPGARRQLVVRRRWRDGARDAAGAAQRDALRLGRHPRRSHGRRARRRVAGRLGDIDIADIAAREARLDLAGSGTLSARGSVEKSHVSLAGSGDVRADGLAAQRTRVSVAGSGDAYVHASEAAKVSIVGSGDVTVRGTSNCRLSRVGSGDVHCAA